MRQDSKCCRLPIECVYQRFYKTAAQCIFAYPSVDYDSTTPHFVDSSPSYYTQSPKDISVDRFQCLLGDLRCRRTHRTTQRMPSNPV